jgi:hypothetical protein
MVIWKPISLVAIALFPIILHGKSLARSFTALYRKIPSELEAEEPLPYRYLWIGTIAFGLLWVISFVLVNVPVQWAILGVIICTVIMIANSRLRAESGSVFGATFSAMFVGASSSFFFWIAQYFGLTADAITALPFMGLMGFVVSEFVFGLSFSNPMPLALESYKIGKGTRTRARDLLVGQAVAIVIAVVTTITVSLWWYYTKGAVGKYGIIEGMVFVHMFPWMGLTTGATGFPQPTNLALYMFIIGLAVCVLMYFFRGRYRWFILSPIGIILALLPNSGGLWFPAVIALILKWITIKVGGGKLYSEKGIPIAAGLILGFCLAWGLGAILMGLAS